MSDRPLRAFRSSPFLFRFLFRFLLLFPFLIPVPAEAIPAFARRYRVSCSLCHNPVPALNDFGEQFAANGYRLATGEVPAGTLLTGDPLLTLMEDLGLAFRLDTYETAKLMAQPALAAVKPRIMPPWLVTADGS